MGEHSPTPEVAPEHLWLLLDVPEFQTIGRGPQRAQVLQSLIEQGILRPDWPVGKVGEGVRSAMEFPEIRSYFSEEALHGDNTPIDFPEMLLIELQHRAEEPPPAPKRPPPKTASGSSLETDDPEDRPVWRLPKLQRFHMFGEKPQRLITLRRLIEKRLLQPFHLVQHVNDDRPMAAGDKIALAIIFREHVPNFDTGFWRKQNIGKAPTSPSTEEMFQAAFKEAVPTAHEAETRGFRSNDRTILEDKRYLPKRAISQVSPPVNGWHKAAKIGLLAGGALLVPYLILNVISLGIGYLPFFSFGDMALRVPIKILYDGALSVGGCFAVASLVGLSSGEGKNKAWNPLQGVVIGGCLAALYCMAYLMLRPTIAFIGGTMDFLLCGKFLIQGIVAGYVVVIVEQSLEQDRKATVEFSFAMDGRDALTFAGAALALLLAGGFDYAALGNYRAAEGGIENYHSNDAGLIAVNVVGVYDPSEETYRVTGSIQNETNKVNKAWFIDLKPKSADRKILAHGRISNKAFRQMPVVTFNDGKPQGENSAPTGGPLGQALSTQDHTRNKLRQIKEDYEQRMEQADGSGPSTRALFAAMGEEAASENTPYPSAGTLWQAQPTRAPLPTAIPTPTPWIPSEKGHLKPSETHHFSVVFEGVTEEPSDLLVSLSPPHAFNLSGPGDLSTFEFSQRGYD